MTIVHDEIHVHVFTECGCESGHCDMHTGECLTEPATVNLCNISKFIAAADSIVPFTFKRHVTYCLKIVPGCDECIWHLIGDLRLSNKTLDQLKVEVLNISTGAAANDKLKYYNYTAHRLQV